MTRRTSFAIALLLPFCLAVLALAPHASTARARTAAPHAAEMSTEAAVRNPGPLYEVDILLIRDDAGRLPRVGSVIERPSHPVYITRVIATLDEVLISGVTHEREFVAGWQPVVGDGVVGYRPEVATASEGAEFHVELHPVTRADHVHVHLEGGMRRIAMRTLQSDFAPPIELPTFSGISLRGQMTLGHGRMYVLAAMTAEDMGSWYLAVSASPLSAQ